MERIPLLENFVAEAAADPEILCVLLVGSAAEETEKLERQKDVDLLVVRRGEDLFCREVQSRDGLVLDISYLSLKDLEQMVHKDNHHWIRLLARSRSLYKSCPESTAPVQKAKDLYFDGPDALTAEDIRYQRFQLTNVYEDLQHGADHETEAEFLANLFLIEALRVYFRLNGQWVPRDKKLLKTLFETDIILYELMKAALRERKVSRRIHLCQDILQYVLMPFGGAQKHWEKGACPLV